MDGYIKKGQLARVVTVHEIAQIMNIINYWSGVNAFNTDDIT